MLSEFKLGTGDEIKADRDCAASGCLVAMHSQLPRFLVELFSLDLRAESLLANID